MATRKQITGANAAAPAQQNRHDKKTGNLDAGFSGVLLIKMGVTFF